MISLPGGGPKKRNTENPVGEAQIVMAMSPFASPKKYRSVGEHAVPNSRICFNCWCWTSFVPSFFGMILRQRTNVCQPVPGFGCFNARRWQPCGRHTSTLGQIVRWFCSFTTKKLVSTRYQQLLNCEDTCFFLIDTHKLGIVVSHFIRGMHLRSLLQADLLVGFGHELS